MTIAKERILELDKLRYSLLDKGDISLDNQIDEYAKQIGEIMIKNYDSLEFDFVFEQLTRLGDSPNLLYDDNGMFAVIGDGFQTVVAESPTDYFESSFFVRDKNVWAETPREALKKYLLSANEEDEE